MPKTNSYEHKLSKLQKEAQRLDFPLNSYVETEIDDGDQCAGVDKQQIDNGAKTVSSSSTTSATRDKTVQLRLRLFNETLPQKLCLNFRWDKSRRARTTGHKSLRENYFSLYKPRGRLGGRPRECPTIPTERQINQLRNKKKNQAQADAAAIKRQKKNDQFRQAVDVLDRAWRQPTLAGRFLAVYKPGEKEKTVCTDKTLWHTPPSI